MQYVRNRFIIGWKILQFVIFLNCWLIDLANFACFCHPLEINVCKVLFTYSLAFTVGRIMPLCGLQASRLMPRNVIVFTLLIFMARQRNREGQNVPWQWPWGHWHIMKNKTGVINDPLGQTHSLASSEHCFVLKSGDGWTDGRTDDKFKNNYHYRPWLWVGFVDQFMLVTMCWHRYYLKK